MSRSVKCLYYELKWNRQVEPILFLHKIWEYQYKIKCLIYLSFFIFSLKIIPHWTVDSASDPDSEWLLHVMTPHFPTKKASETAQWPTGHLGAALKSWSQHSFKPLSDKLDFQPFDWSKKKGSKKSYLLVEKPTAKGQMISEAIFLVLKSSKKQTMFAKCCPSY